MRRTGLRCIVLVWVQEACIYPSPRPSRGEGSWSLRSDVATGGCCFRAFCCRASVFCGVVLPAGGLPVGGRAPCRSVRRFPAFRPRTPCFCNPLKVSLERYDYVLSSVLKTDASTAAFAKLQGIRVLQNYHVRIVHFRSLAGA